MESANDSFPAADADNALNPGNNTTVDLDPISSQIADEKKEEKSGEAKEEKKGKGKNDPMQTFKTTMIVSGVIIVVLGVALAVTKKLKENKS